MPCGANVKLTGQNSAAMAWNVNSIFIFLPKNTLAYFTAAAFATVFEEKVKMIGAPKANLEPMKKDDDVLVQKNEALEQKLVMEYSP